MNGAMTTDVSPNQLKQAVASQHGGEARFVQAVPFEFMSIHGNS